MKISKAFALAAAAITIFSAAAAVHAGDPSVCVQSATDAYNQVMKNYPPLPGDQQCAGVPDQYKAQCIAAVDAQRASVLAAAQNAYNTAYYSCIRGGNP
jgi:hypothetical protein